MKTDAQLGRDIEAELAGEPSINATHVGVAVDEVVVTLRGQCIRIPSATPLVAPRWPPRAGPKWSMSRQPACSGAARCRSAFP